jgi:16S rRNA (guanine966-N2)-methyltransferase
MRIVAGTFRGRPLVAPKGHITRPTADRARQAIFNVLEHAAWAPRLEGARVIDLFAGSGAMGIEALSRGAASCLFVERAAPARVAIHANLAALGLEDCARLDRRDATNLPARTDADGPGFDLAFLDPPYGEAAGETALQRLAEGGWLAPGALAVLERGADETAAPPPGYELVDERRWGAAKVSFLRLA